MVLCVCVCVLCCMLVVEFTASWVHPGRVPAGQQAALGATTTTSDPLLTAYQTVSMSNVVMEVDDDDVAVLGSTHGQGNGKAGASGSSGSSSSSSSLPWVEKYRPSSLDQLIAHEEIVNILTRLIDSNNLPHLLFHGPPGTGQSPTRLCF
jgi:hypothetical protein